MFKLLYVVLGLLSLGLGAIGAFVPLLPTVPFLILAAFFFARGSGRLDGWIRSHRHFGPPIEAWRNERRISRKGKRAAYLSFAASALIGLIALPFPWMLVPASAAIIGSAWISKFPD